MKKQELAWENVFTKKQCQRIIEECVALLKEMVSISTNEKLIKDIELATDEMRNNRNYKRMILTSDGLKKIQCSGEIDPADDVHWTEREEIINENEFPSIIEKMQLEPAALKKILTQLKK